MNDIPSNILAKKIRDKMSRFKNNDFLQEISKSNIPTPSHFSKCLNV